MLTDIDLVSLEYLCLNMREADKVEIFACQEHENPMRLAWEAHYLIRNKGRGRIAWHDGRPAACCAFTESWPGVWQVWMFGTDELKSVAVELLRWSRKEARDILSVCHGIRLQCESRVGHDEAHKMLKAMGAVPEGDPMPAYGKDGAAYQRFVWLKDVNDDVLKPGFIRAA